MIHAEHAVEEKVTHRSGRNLRTPHPAPPPSPPRGYGGFIVTILVRPQLSAHVTAGSEPSPLCNTTTAQRVQLRT